MNGDESAASRSSRSETSVAAGLYFPTLGPHNRPDANNRCDTGIDEDDSGRAPMTPLSIPTPCIRQSLFV